MHIVLFGIILIGRGVLVGERFICVFDILCGDVFRIVVVHQKVIVKIVTAAIALVIIIDQSVQALVNVGKLITNVVNAFIKVNNRL